LCNPRNLKDADSKRDLTYFNESQVGRKVSTLWVRLKGGIHPRGFSGSEGTWEPCELPISRTTKPFPVKNGRSVEASIL